MSMEILGYTADGCIDARLEGVRMIVPNDMNNRHRQVIAVWEAEGNLIPPYLPPALAVRVYRSTFIGRMTNAEAEVLEATMAAAEPKLRLLFQSVEYFVSDDPLFAVLHWTVAVALGSEEAPNIVRADQLLAAE